VSSNDANNDANNDSASRALVRGGATLLSASITGLLLGAGIAWIVGNSMGTWLLARSAGITAYVLLTIVTLTGLWLSHPKRYRWRRPSPPTRIRIHIVLTVFTLVFLIMHIVALVMDPYAKVGWTGALLPFGSEYRPLPVTLGLISVWAGLIAGITAALAGRMGRWWAPLHKAAGLTWVLAWLHSVLSGSDTAVIVILYIVTGVMVLGMAIWRYSAKTPADAQAEFHAKVTR
jgi:DMSO/TMAO reductase YedYZ heme-binding membrane subunit